MTALKIRIFYGIPFYKPENAADAQPAESLSPPRLRGNLQPFSEETL